MYQEEDLDLKQEEVHGNNICVISNESEFSTLLEVLKDNDSKYISIDLSNFKLTIKDLEKLNKIMQGNIHIGYIKFSSEIKNNDENIKEGKQEEGNDSYLEVENTDVIAKLKNEIFKKCNENNQLLRCPSDYVHGLISADIYNDLKEGESKNFNSENWQVMKIYHTKDSSYYGALYQNISTFIGREEALLSIEAILNSKNKCIISGLEGAGKSSLAVKYGSIQQENNITVRWIDAANAETLTQSAIKFATDLHISPEGKTIDNICREISLRLNNMINADNSKKQTLLILDNLEDYELIEKFLPNLSSNIKLLITARSKTLYVDQNLSEVKLEFFSESEAKEYIEFRLEQYKDQAKELIEKVGMQPNKLSIAVSQIKKSKISIKSYIQKEKYKDVIESSFKCLETLKPEAMQLLAYTAYLYAGNIPFSLLPKEVLNEEIISELEGLSLLTSYDGEQEVLSIHMEVQEKLFDLIENGKIANIAKDLIIENIINALDEQMPETDDNPNHDWKTAIKLAPHIEYLLNAVKNSKEYSTEKLASVIRKLASYDQYITLNYNKALENYNIVLKIYREVYKDSPNNPNIACVFRNIGSVYYEQGQYRESLNYYMNALIIYREVYKDSPNHLNIADSLRDIGQIYLKQDQQEEALDYNLKALEILKEIYKDSPNHPGIAFALNNVGNIYHEQEQYEEALNYYLKVLEILKEVYKDSPNHPDIAYSLTDIAQIYQAQGQHEEALEYNLKALEVLKEVYKDQPDHPDIADSLTDIGQIYLKQKLYKEALNYCKEALEICDKSQYSNISQLIDQIQTIEDEQSRELLPKESDVQERLWVERVEKM